MEDDFFRLATIGDFLNNCATALQYGDQEDLAELVTSVSTFCWAVCKSSLNGPGSAPSVASYILKWFDSRDWDTIESSELFALVVHCEILAGKT
jgi:hypothetical protein